MPLPRPNKNEKEKEFISRCMGNDTMVNEFPKQNVRAGVCYSLYRKAKKKKTKEGSIEEPTWDEIKPDIEKDIMIY